MITPKLESNWKQFVIVCCRLGVQNSSAEIATAVSKSLGKTVTPGQVAAVKANYARGAYSN